MLKIELPIPPSVNQAYGLSTQYVGGKVIPYKFLTSKAKSYKRYVQTTCKRIMKENNIKTLTQDKSEFIEIELVFFLDKKRKDVDNTFKLMFDGIVDSGLILDDDIILYQVKNIFIDRKNPRVELTIKKSEKTGIFNTKEDMLAFTEKNCVNCKKYYYKRNCSILKTATDNIITENINLKDMECNNKVARDIY